MAATEHDDDRWRLALDLARENAQQYQTLVRIVQNGFGSIGERLDGNSKRIAVLENEVKGMHAVEIECQRELVVMKVDWQGHLALMRVLVAFVIALLVFSLLQMALWGYVVMRLFHL